MTLITGDRVRYAGSGSALKVMATLPAQSHPHTLFITTRQNGDTFVVPLDAWHGVRIGSIDRNLFDITLLDRDHYDDAHTAMVHVIVTSDSSRPPALRMSPAARATTSALPLVGAQSVRVAKTRTAALWSSLTRPVAHRAHTVTTKPGTRLWLDGLVHATDDVSTPLIGAPQAWKAGYTGRGVRVAVLDTGIDAAHPDLTGKVVSAMNFSDSPSIDDHAGHGTHVASIITGSGAASGGLYRGVAPDVRLLDGKVLDDAGSGDDAAVLAGMNWAIAQHAKIVNMSLGGSVSDGTDVLSLAVDRLSLSSGTLFVIAAGNEGASGTVESPGAATEALTVASTTTSDSLSTFSSQGPRLGDYGAKPDVAAPGSGIVGARVPGTFPSQAVDADYVRLSGTSMATPHVAGAAAILAQEHPSWTGQQLKTALMGSARAIPGLGAFQDGAGRVDVAAAVQATVEPITAAISFGEHTTDADAAVVTRSVRYANDGTSPVQLQLKLDIDTANGSPAAPGVFSLANSVVTVPPHGTAEATITLHPAGAAPAGFDGRLVAIAPGVSIHTPVSAELHQPTHTVEVKISNPLGQLVSSESAFAVLQDVQTGRTFDLPNPDGDMRADIPGGDYRVIGAAAYGDQPVNPETAVEFVRGPITVAGDLTIAVNTGDARPVDVTVDRPGARPGDLAAQFAILSNVTGTTDSSSVGAVSNFSDITVSAPQAVPGVRYAYLAAWTRPSYSVDVPGSPPFHADASIICNIQAGWQGDITAPVVDIHEDVDPGHLPDVKGKIVLESPDFVDGQQVGTPPSDDELTTLAHALHDRGAQLVIAYDYFATTDVIPVLQMFNPNDIAEMRAALASGTGEAHVVGRPSSPYVYNLYRTTTDALPDGFTWHVHTADLARVNQTMREPLSAPHFSDDIVQMTDPQTGVSGGTDVMAVLPLRRVQYYTPGVEWGTITGVGNSGDPNMGEPADEIRPLTSFRVGQPVNEAWGTAPFTAALPAFWNTNDDGQHMPWVYRDSNKIVASIPTMTSANPNHILLDNSLAFTGETSDAGTTTLYRGSRLVDASDEPGVGQFVVPQATGTYRLVVDASRGDAGWFLAPHVHAEWTFDTAAGTGSSPTALPLLSPWFDLPLDLSDRASASAPLHGSVTLTRQLGSGDAQIQSVHVGVSFDEGAHWLGVTTTGNANNTYALTFPAPPAGAGFADLRITAKDASGSGLAETIHHAYGLH